MFSFRRPHLVRALRAQVRYMATEKELKKRIVSVESIKKITKASKMVAAAKLRGVQNMLIIGRKFCAPAINIWKSEDEIKAEADETAKRVSEKNYVLSKAFEPDIISMLVPLTSDRGLCGGINSSVVRATRRIIDENESRHPPILCMGERGRTALSRTHANLFLSAFVDVSKQAIPTFEQAMAVSSIFLQQKFDTAFLISNRFKSAIAYDTILQEIPSAKMRLAGTGPLSSYECEGDETVTVTNLSEFSTAVTFYKAMLENSTTEQSQKMSAMENSTKNAGELIESLKIEYNRSRQARITTELIEIISGAAALE